MRVRVQLSNPQRPTPSDRRRGLLLVREFQALGVDAELHQPGEPFDVLILRDLAYARWLPEVESGLRRGAITIHDVTNDVFTYWRSSISRGRHSGLRGSAWLWAGARQRVGLILGLRNWGSGPRFWRSCRAIVAGSPEQASRYRPYNSRTYALLDAVDPAEYRRQAGTRDNDPPVAVWEGAEDNVVYFRPYLDAFRASTSQGKIALRIVTASRRSTPYRGLWDNRELLRSWRLDSEFVEWEFGRSDLNVASSDIGLAPLPLNDPYASAKPANKLMIYAYLGLPVVASAVPSYLELLEEGRFGFTVRTSEEWTDRLALLADSPTLRRELGERGREYALSTVSPRSFAQRYADIIERALDESAVGAH